MRSLGARIVGSPAAGRIDDAFGRPGRAAGVDLDAARMVPLPPWAGEDVDVDFSEICDLARRLFHCPTAVVSLSGTRRLDGLDEPFGEAVLGAGAPVVVPDARVDSRYRDAFLVTAYPFVRFYAGAPIFLGESTVVGVLSLMDYRPRDDFLDAERDSLASCARLAGGEVWRRVTERARSQERLQVARLAAEAPAGVVEIDDAGRIVGVNGTVERLTGARPDMLLGAPATRYVAGWEQVVRHCRLLLDIVDGLPELPSCLVDVIAVDGGVVPARAVACCWLEGGRVRHRLVLEPIG